MYQVEVVILIEHQILVTYSKGNDCVVARAEN